MNINLNYSGNYKFTSFNSEGNTTEYDIKQNSGGDGSAMTPMEHIIGALNACSSVDIIMILRKKRKNIIDYKVEAVAERAETMPKIFTDIQLKFFLTSDNTTENEFETVVNLSLHKYCSVSAMLEASGCKITSECIIIKPSE